MRVLISGAGGLIGSALRRRLLARGDTVLRLVRARPRDPTEFRWDPVTQSIDPAALTGCDAVVHLAGASIAAGRWSAGRKAGILESRRLGTRLIATAIARAQPPTPVLVSASGIGFYGDRGDEVLDERSAAGGGFLADVTRVWEGEARAAAEAGARVVHTRFGIVLAAEGGALPKLVLPFRFGLGVVMGSGRQWASWVTLDDAVRVILCAISPNDLSGPVNVVAPAPVTHREFVRAIGRALRRPWIVSMPPILVRAALGEMGRELLLFGQRAIPSRLAAVGFTFEHADLDRALAHVLGAGREGGRVAA